MWPWIGRTGGITCPTKAGNNYYLLDDDTLALKSLRVALVGLREYWKVSGGPIPIRTYSTIMTKKN